MHSSNSRLFCVEYTTVSGICRGFQTYQASDRLTASEREALCDVSVANDGDGMAWHWMSCDVTTQHDLAN